MAIKRVDALPDLAPDDIVVLPLGAIEQHGPHLPLETDALIADGLAERLCASQFAGNVLILPTERIGYSPEHLDHPGTRSLTWKEALERWIAIGEEVAGKGGRRFVMLNAHGGNSPLMTLVAQELRVAHSLLAVATSWTRFIKDTDLVSGDEISYGIHGGDVETSVMLALHPHLVAMENTKNFPNLQESLAGRYHYLRAYGPHAFGWKAYDLNPNGVTGDASAASAEKGERLLDEAVSGFLTLLNEVADFETDIYFLNA